MRTLLVIAGLCTFVSAQTFKSTVDEVAVPVTIQSELAQAGDIGPDDFRVFDDGRPVPIVTFGKIRQFVHVVLLLDTSRSMAQSLDDVRAAANAVIARLAPGDFIQVGTFSRILRLSPSFTADDKEVVSRLPFVPGENMTMLYDALLEGCSAFTSESGRRVIFVVSDGLDTASSETTRTVMQRAAEANVSIYAVGVDSGRDYTRLFGVMIEELHQQYLLGLPLLRQMDAFIRCWSPRGGRTSRSGRESTIWRRRRNQ